MVFLKHVGKHGDRMVCILYKTVPGEDHMCLLVYPQVLPAPWHDAIMKVLESEPGQQADEFSDALHRNLLPDGRPILETLHHERMIKKVRTSDIIVTPRPGSSIRLDELNKMLTEMKTGDVAKERMALADKSRGMVAPEVKRAAEAAFKESKGVPKIPQIVAGNDGALSDRDIAGNMLAQAQRMEAEGKGLLDESARMKKDAERMHPGVVSKETVSITTPSVKRTRGPGKAKTAVVADAAS